MKILAFQIKVLSAILVSLFMASWCMIVPNPVNRVEKLEVLMKNQFVFESKTKNTICLESGVQLNTEKLNSSHNNLPVINSRNLQMVADYLI